MKALTITLIVIIAVLLVAFVVLYFLGRKAEKKQAEQQKTLEANAQTVNLLVIYKKKLKLKEAGLPSIVVEQTPKYMRRAKLPIVKVKAGPKVMNLICDGKIFDQILPKQEIKATVSGIYITNFKRIRGPVYEPKKKKGNVVNLLGFFSPLMDDCELYGMLEKAGVKAIHEISRCKDYEEYQTMAEANFNLVLHPEARFAAEDFHEKLQIPFIELRRLYQIDKITKQYQALGKVLGIPFEDHEAESAALDSVKCLKSAKPDAVFAIGECMNGDPFELALALVKYGFRVAEIYGTLTAENFVYLKNLSELSPQTKVFSNMEPTMLYYDPEESGVTITIGKDACYYHPDVKNVMWNEEVQPYGYAGVKHLCEKLLEV